MFDRVGSIKIGVQYSPALTPDSKLVNAYLGGKQ